MPQFTIQLNVTEKEKTIVKLLADGSNVREISLVTGINNRTLEAKIIELKRKYSSHTLAELVAIFLRNKLIE